MAEKELMRTVYEIRNKEPMFDEIFAAHRDLSLLTGTIVTEMPPSDVEQETWTDDKFKFEAHNFDWIETPDIEVRTKKVHFSNKIIHRKLINNYLR